MFKLFRITLLLWLIADITANHSLSAKSEADFSNPRATMKTYLNNLSKKSYHPAAAANAFNLTEEKLNEEGEEIAVSLKKIFDANALHIELIEIPDTPDYIDSASGENRYVISHQLPQVYLEKYGNKWLFSKFTVETLPDIYQKTFPIDEDELRSILPKAAFKQIFGLKIWQISGIVLFILISWLLLRLIEWLFRFIMCKVSRKIQVFETEISTIKPLSKSISWLILIIILKSAVPLLHLPIDAGIALSYLFKILIPFFAARILYVFSDLLINYLHKLASKTKTTIDDNLLPLGRKALKIIVVVFGGLYILKSLEIDITPVLAGVSIGGLAIALAAQDMVKNLFGSVTILSDQPFAVGDWINFDGTDATVIEVGLRSTKLRTFYDSLISIPNGKLADMKIDNMGKRQFRRFMTNLGITYDTPPAIIEAFVSGLREIVTNHPKTRKDEYKIFLNSFSDSSLNILFYIFFEVPDWRDELEARQEIMLSIIRLSQELEVRFAFPTRTMHVENFPEKRSMTPEYHFSENSLKEKLERFVIEEKGKNDKNES
ncbi:MAG: MscS family rane protein [Bacteroidota bacterium]|nr:MscS family rane protein [Bacteroidota bacterium]